MSAHSIDMLGLTTKVFVTNSRRGSDYKCTIQNNTGEVLTVTATNMDVQDPDITAVFAQPAAGAVTPPINGGLDIITDPYRAFTLTLANAGTAGETVEIVEAG